MNTQTIRTAIFLMIGYFIITSRLFIQTFFKKIPGTLDYEMLSIKGNFIAAFLLALYYILIDFLISHKLI